MIVRFWILPRIGYEKRTGGQQFERGRRFWRWMNVNGMNKMGGLDRVCIVVGVFGYGVEWLHLSLNFSLGTKSFLHGIRYTLHIHIHVYHVFGLDLHWIRRQVDSSHAQSTHR